MTNRLRKKYGVVAVLDALGAANYSDSQIRSFLSARTEINSWVTTLAKQMKGGGPLSGDSRKGVKVFCMPTMFTFGDTIVITIELRSKKYIIQHLRGVFFLLRRYLFHSLLEGILFRGSFSVGAYIEDAESNTVMGPALADAASWYTKSEWMGVSSTPKANSVLEYYSSGEEESPISPVFICKYDVPLKDRRSQSLYAITWPSAFLDNTLLKRAQKETGRKWFLEILKELPVPSGTEAKYDNTKMFFDFVEQERSAKMP